MPWLALAGFLAQTLLWLNPGYLSHDELQWGFYADTARVADLPWVSWTDVATFQYRPLTFNLWLLLSHHLFDSPSLFHALFVVLGTGNALLLFCLLHTRFGTGPALVGFAAFLLSPYSAWVHGWVATLADLLWLAAALLLAHLLERVHRPRPLSWIAVVACVATALGLLAKEAGLAIPALLALAWLTHRRNREWAAALLGSGVAALAYLLLRLAPIDTGSAGGAYAWSFANVPHRLGEYLLFPWTLGLTEPVALWTLGPIRLVLPASLLLLFLLGLARAGWRSAIIWLLAAAAALGPTLLLAAPSSQYAYGFAAVLAAAVAHAWRRSRGWLVLPLAFMLAHGVQIQAALNETGRIERRFYADVVAALTHHPDLRLLPDENAWIYLRLTHDIPAYGGVPIGERVRVVETPEQATHRVAANGGLVPLPQPDR